MTVSDTVHIENVFAVQKNMYAKDFHSALDIIESILQDSPDNLDVIYMKAACLRYLRHYEDALIAIKKVKSISPEFGRAHQEEGHIFLALGKYDFALKAFERACHYNPALESSWLAQEKIHNRLGQKALAAQCLAQADRLKILPKEIKSISLLMHEGKLLKAEEFCRRFLKVNPSHVEAMRLLAEIGERLGIMDDAEFLLESAIEFEPENIQLKIDYIKILKKRQKFQLALEVAKQLYNKAPKNPVFQSQLAVQYMQIGDYEAALSLFENVLKKLPNDPITLTSIGHAQKTFGRHDEAVTSYRKACLAKPDHGEAYFSLANLKTYSFTTSEINHMKNQLDESDLSYREKIHFCFALGKAHEDLGSYEQSFKFYEQGNNFKLIQSRYDKDQMTLELQAQIDHCPESLFKKNGASGYKSNAPIFIVGLPRAGSTLLEQIIASHSLVDGTLELPNILTIAHELRGRGRGVEASKYPKNLNELTNEKFKELGQRYIHETRIHRKQAPFFIDKMPNNFRHIGLIRLILPNAKIIDARRGAMACCFSGFKQLFAEGQEFTYGLETIGQYYRDYVKLMEHWDKVIPSHVLKVEYENVVTDAETEIRRILDYLGLPFEHACLEFHKTKRSVRTASSEQVRQPIFKSGLEQWKNFEPWLSTLKTSLNGVIEHKP